VTETPSAKVPVVILRLSPYPAHPGTIGLIRTLGRLGAPVHLITERSPAQRSRYVCSWTVAPPSTDPAAVFRSLNQLDVPGAVLVPVDDVGLLLVEREREHLAGCFLVPEQPPGVAAGLSDKERLQELAKRAGVPILPTFRPRTGAEAREIADDMGFPLVCKVAKPRPGAGRSVTIVRSARELADVLIRTTRDSARPNLVLQEYVAVGSQTRWMVNAYYDAASRPLFAATARKVRQWPAATGATSWGVTDNRPELLELHHRLMTSVGYCGIVDAGYLHDPRDGRFKVVDVNPRIGATFRLFTGRGGTDVARALYLDLTGQLVQPDEVPNGRTWMVEHRDLASAVVSWRRGELRLASYARALPRVSEAAWWDRDDPRPGVALAGAFAGEAVRRVRRWILRSRAARR